MGTVKETLECPVCQDFFTDPVTLPCGHDFCLTCIQAVWETGGSDEGPSFCPECQIFLHSDVTLEINTSLQTKVKDFAANRPSTTEPWTTTPSSATKSSSTIRCDHCIETPSVAIRTCLTCDASLCQAHALLHQQRSALREHTVVEVTRDPLSLKCREHRDELKLFCMEERVPVCCLCVLVGMHKDHKVFQLHEACADFKTSAADFKERISDKYSRIRVVLDGDERLMMQIIEAEETYMIEWLEAQRGHMEAQIREIDSLRASRKPLLHEEVELRFLQYSVLAQESLTTGRHYWEVIVQEKPYWLVGVTTGPVDKGDAPSQSSSSLGVNNTSWCIYHGDGQYLACHDTQEKQLSVGKRCTEPLYPMLNPCIDVIGLNTQPLTMFWIKDHWDGHVNTEGAKE
ncbi:E3 ubiquitin/ISG15 ligase TRIM25-like [Clinocottus analis]|uniref:E3 ubiquitin/ISG15 ligase TRIM25-like n=1 Tax=Clinocottus analis TaxID=304258 RepID=UPI0035BF66D3